MNKTFERGGVYLANLNPSRGAEVGKIRPVVVIQTNKINQTNDTIITLPLSTKLLNDSFLHFRINKRDSLFSDSDVLCVNIRAIDANKFISNILTKLNKNEMQQIEKKLEWILGFHDYH